MTDTLSTRIPASHGRRLPSTPRPSRTAVPGVSRFRGVFLSLLVFPALPGAQVLVNELTGDIGIHDPVMIKEGNTYHVFGTHDTHLMSTDRKAWRRGPSVFTRETFPVWVGPMVPGNDRNFWAPDIHFRDGKFHLYYAASAWGSITSAIGFASTVTLDQNSPNYRWVDQGMVVRSVQGQDNPDRNNSNAIDPNIYVDDNGDPWLNWGSFCCAPLDGIRLVKLDRTTGKPVTDPPKLTSISSSGEGSFIIKRGQYFFLLVSVGTCCSGVNSTYHVVMGRSLGLTGPYLDKTGRNMNQGGYSVLLRGNERYPGVGHNGIFTERDTTFLVFHAYDR